MVALSLDDRRRRQAAIYDKITAGHAGRRGKIARKQVSDQAHWLTVWHQIGQDANTGNRAALLVEKAAIEAQRGIHVHADGPVAYGWSGGKDSLALQIVMQQVGVTECAFVITELEWPGFLSWATDRMPDGCTVIHRREINLIWLANHPEMLFPPDAIAAGKWFSAVQHTGQQQYNHAHGISLMMLGRRTKDGNVVGKDGFMESKRGRFFNPIRDWTHEDVLTVLRAYNMELPPTYTWPRGFQVGTGPWPARQFCRSIDHGWQEVYTISPTVVEDAAVMIPSARAWLSRHNLN